jgi:hypothetical protein
MTEQPDWLKAHYDNTCATRARGDNLAGIATALGGLIEQRHAQEEALLPNKIELIEDELARARVHHPVQAHAPAVEASTGLEQGANILSDLPNVAAEQSTSPAKKLTHIMDLVYGRVAPQTDEERQIVEDDKQWKRQHTTWPKVRRNPGPIDFDESRFRG